MSKTERIEARVLPTRRRRYEEAAALLRLDEMSDFVRRACDDLADRVIGGPQPNLDRRQQTLGRAGGTLRDAKPDPKKKR